VRIQSAFLLALVGLLAGCGPESASQDGDGAGSAPPPGSEAPPADQVLGPDACRDSGYLCAGLTEREEARVLRWNENTAEIRIRIPPPPVEPASRARQLQDAVARGILAWQEKPFVLRIDRSARTGTEDFAVEWADRIGVSELGRAQTEWTRTTSGEMAMRVPRFVLAYLNPFEAGTLLTPKQVQLTAAHEMGHALGLPHSDSPRDVMYPTNTATSLTPRDFETMWGLYALPNGAVLDEDARPGG
jgi:predicted Zn-dependent protease